MINLDKAALNSVYPGAERSILRAISLHRPTSNALGLQSKSFLQDCKARIANHFSRDPLDLSFFGSATAAVRFVAKKLKEENAFSIVVPRSEHSCSLSVATHKLDVDKNGQPVSILDELCLQSDSDAIIISLKNNETGITPSANTREQLEIAKSKGTLLIVDATGGDWNDPLIKSADYIFASAGKWHGLPGLGILLGTKKLWDDQPTEGLGGVIGGSPNMIGISCLADAMDWISGPHGSGRLQMVSSYEKILDDVASSLGWQKNGSGRGVANYFTGLPSDLFMSMAEEQGLNISAGSACNSGMDNPSHVITAMYDASRASRSLRFSWDLMTKEEEILSAVKIVKDVDNMLRAQMPYGENR